MPSKVDCVLGAAATLGEGIVWDTATASLWWVDIAAPALHRFDPESGRDETWPMPSAIGCVAPRRAGGAMICLEEGWSTFDPASGRIEVLNAQAPRGTGMRFNDGAVDPHGRFWAGTMPKAGPANASEGEPAIGDLFRLDPDGGSSLILDGLYIQNGLAFSPDGSVMYLSDSHPTVRTIWAFDYALETGTPSNRRVFFDTRQVDGRPDGAAIDADGCYWMAGVDGWQVIRITPAGTVDRIVPVPVQKPTCLAFGGPRLDTLYLTSMGPGLIAQGTEDRQPDAGGLFALNPGVPGYAPPPCAA
ncbi:MAG: SMP-30/gluconolactonase/LRE family protein [Alphaproteobacteria bacterium]|nr:SMP-30/gluconolactonase/LRE family protein [Alphaproteobacteria bacterium]